MTEQDDLRNDLDTEVFAVLGKVVTLTSFTTPTYNTRGEIEVVAAASISTITVVPYNINHTNQSYQPYGEMNEGDMFVAIRYSISVSRGDELNIENEIWKIKNIEYNYLPGNVVTLAHIFRVH